MTDEKQYTERDMIRARREGYAKHCEETCKWSREARKTFAESAYPLPKVTRARVVWAKVGPYGFDWRLVRNTLECASPGVGDWEPYKVERGEWADIAKILNDLLANPTETCPDE